MGDSIISDHLGFFSVHPMHGTRAFLHFVPIKMRPPRYDLVTTCFTVKRRNHWATTCGYQTPYKHHDSQHGKTENCAPPSPQQHRHTRNESKDINVFVIHSGLTLIVGSTRCLALKPFPCLVKKINNRGVLVTHKSPNFVNKSQRKAKQEPAENRHSNLCCFLKHGSVHV